MLSSTPGSNRSLRSRVALAAIVHLTVSIGVEVRGAEMPTHVYFGDLHVHTRYSNDAFALTNERTPDDAYRFAKGQALPHAGERLIRMHNPLDFLAVTDHAEYLGAFQSFTEIGYPHSDDELVKLVRSEDPIDGAQAYFAFSRALRGNRIPEVIERPELVPVVWKEIVDAADRHYEPGEFTTFAAYEWTASKDGSMMHRNVIFEDTEDLPLPFSSLDSGRPQDLWSYLERHRRRGVRALAIPHNMNYSGGFAFAVETYDGDPFTADYAARRVWNEPLVEVIQHKGASETHPLLSPNDEFADFELYPAAHKPQALETLGEGESSGRYAREALINGVRLQAEFGFNPFQFGLVAASDFHSSASAVEENNFRGSYGFGFGATPRQRLFQERPWDETPLTLRSAGGLTAVWAPENTRQAIYAGLRRRETYATSGTRIRVRFFAGWDYEAALLEREDWVEAAYAGGVPMGSVIDARDDRAPRLLVWAAKDPASGNLDRIQVVKGWPEEGERREKIFDVALADGRKVRRDGSVPPVGNTVDVASATFTNEIGDAQLATVWEDPEFDPSVPAVYYVRVLEIPTPRWSTHDAVRLGVEPPDEVPATIQERAYTSAIWYLPDGGEG